MERSDPYLNTIAKGAFLVFLGIFISKILGYAYRIIIARIGPEEYGLISIALAIFGFLAAISLLGMGDAIIRFISFYDAKQDNQKIKSTILSTLKIAIPLSILLSFILFINAKTISLNFFHNIRLTPILKIFAIAVPFDVIGNIFFSTLRAFKKIKYEVLSKNILENLIKVILTFILLIMGFGIVGAAFSYLIAIILTTILSFYFLNKVFPFKNKLKTINMNKELIKYSWPLMFSSLLFMIILWTDTLMLGYFRNAVETGLYNAALPTAQLLFVIPNGLSILFVPVLTGLYTQNKKYEFKKVYKTVNKWILMINIIALTMLVLFPKTILKILFKEQYLSASNVLIILSISFFIAYTLTNLHNILLIYKKTRLILYNTISAVVTNISLNYLLIPKYGIIGAGIATGTSFILIIILGLIETIYITKLNPFKLKYINILVSIIISSLIIIKITQYYPIKDLISLIVIGIVLTIIYLILLFVTKSFEKEDILMFKTIKNKIIKTP